MGRRTDGGRGSEKSADFEALTSRRVQILAYITHNLEEHHCDTLGDTFY